MSEDTEDKNAVWKTDAVPLTETQQLIADYMCQQILWGLTSCESQYAMHCDPSKNPLANET